MPVLLLGEIEKDYAYFENSYIQYTLLKEYKDFDIKSASHIEEVNEKQTKLTGLYSQKRFDSKELILKRKDVARHEGLFKKGVISRQELEQKKIELFQSEKFAKNTILSISELKNEIGLSEKNLKLNDIDKIRAEKKLIKELFQNYSKLKISISDWEKKYLIKSSRDGIVNFLKYRKQNDFVEENELFVSVIPNEYKEPLGKLKTSVLNSGKLQIGQRVNIKLDNYPFLEYGMLVGEIINISSIPDENQEYLIDVKIDEKLLTTYNINLPFQHDMVGTANIITQDVSLFERLFNHLKHLITKNKKMKSS